MWTQEAGRPLHSVYIGLCFKLNHLSRADTRGDVWDVGTRQPPFSRIFIPDDEVLQHLRQRQAALQPTEGVRMCSDFKADEVIFLYCLSLHTLCDPLV